MITQCHEAQAFCSALVSPDHGAHTVLCGMQSCGQSRNGSVQHPLHDQIQARTSSFSHGTSRGFLVWFFGGFCFVF